MWLHAHVFCTKTAANPSAQIPGHHRYDLLAGLQAVRLQEVSPTTAASTLEALATLKHLRSLDMPCARLHDRTIARLTCRSVIA